MRIAKTFTFDAAHRLQNHDGKCKNLHGHTYHVEIVLEGQVVNEPDSPVNGMVMDFGDLKDTFQTEVHEYLDHSTILESDDPLVEALNGHTGKVNTFEFPPTAENLATWIRDELQNRLTSEHGRSSFFVWSVRVYETPTSWAEA